MSGIRKLLLAMLLVATVTVILVTWGSIGSIVLTLGLLIDLGAILLNWVMQHRNPDDFDWEG